MTQSVSPPLRYWAFISYSSRDQKIAAWLTRRLESYPIPKIFHDTVLSDGAKLGQRLKPVFRDRDELTGSAELGPAIYKALEQSRYLIVLCSRNSAKSRWVNKEIEDFQALGRNNKILALILDGEPNATGNPNVPDDEECFPPALRYPNAEPIAGDLRKEADGRERGFLKVLAGAAELDFDALYRRHERAQKKRRLVAGSVAGMIMLALGGLSWFALVQKSEAQRKTVEVKVANTKIREEGRKMEALLEEAAMSDQAVANRKWHEGDERGALAHLSRAMRYRPESPVLGPMAVPKILDISAEAPLWRSEGHGDKVIRVAFSPDGRHVATASVDKTARIWDAASGKELHRLARHTSSVFDVNFSHDGKRLVTSSANGTAWIWDVETGKELHHLVGHDDRQFVNHAIFSPDGAFVVTGSDDKTAKIWSASTGELIRTLADHKKQIQAVAFSSDGRRVMTASGDPGSSSGLPASVANTTIIHDMSTDKDPVILAGHTDAVYNAIFSPDGQTALTCSADGTARIWDAGTGKESHLLRHGDSIEAIAFSPDGQRVLTGSSDNSAKLWDATTGEELMVLKGHAGWVSSVAFSPDGLLLATASHDHTVRIWDSTVISGVGSEIPTGAEIIRMEHSDTIRSMAFSPDGQQLATASWDGTARLWSTVRGRAPDKPMFHRKKIRQVSFTPDASMVITMALDRVVRVWDASSGEMLRSFGENSNPIEACWISPDGNQLFTRSSDQNARLWDIRSGEQLLVLKQDGIRRIAFSSDGKRLFTNSADNITRAWDSANGAEIMRFAGHEGAISSLLPSPDGRLIATASSDRTARIWDAASGKELHSLNVDSEKAWLSFSPDSRSLSTFTPNEAILKIWDAASGNESAWLQEIPKEITSVEFSPDSKRIVIGSEDATAQINDVSSGRVIAKLLGHLGPIKVATFSPDGLFVLTAASTRIDDAKELCSVRIWNAASGVEVSRYTGSHAWVEDACFSQDGTKVLVGFEDYGARIWKLPPLDARMPEWFSEFLTWRSGKRLTDDSEMKELTSGELKVLADRLRAHAEGNDPYARLVRWSLFPNRERPVDPYSDKSRIDQASEILSWDGTWDDYMHAYFLDPRNPLIHLAMATVEENSVTADFHRRYDLDRLPNEPALQRRAAGLLQDQEQWELALGCTERVLARLPEDPPSLEQRAVFLSNLGRKSEALEAWRTALKHDGKNVDWLTSAALVASHLGGHDEARSLIDQAAVIEPNNQMVWSRSGWCLVEKHDWAGALAAFERAKPLPGDLGFSIGFGLAVSLWQTGDHAAAVKTFVPLIGDEPELATDDGIKQLGKTPLQTEILEAVQVETLKQHPELKPKAE